MAERIKTIERKSGVFEGKPYDNIYLHTLDAESGKDTIIFGPSFNTHKIKADLFGQILARHASALDFVTDVNSLEGLCVVVYYDQNKKPIDFNLFKDANEQ